MTFVDLKFDATGQMYAAFQTIEELTSKELAYQVQADIEKLKDIYCGVESVNVTETKHYVHVRVKYFSLVTLYIYSKITGDVMEKSVTRSIFEMLSSDFGYKLVSTND